MDQQILFNKSKINEDVLEELIGLPADIILERLGVPQSKSSEEWKEKSSFEYNLLFNNILNLNRFEYINSSVGLLGTEESTVIALHGYITGGIKFYF